MCKKEEQDGCRKRRDVKPGDCTPEQIQECHGSEGCHPCNTDPSDCTPERIRECHGPEAVHPCEQD